jgi:hypothetical protein
MMRSCEVRMKAAGAGTSSPGADGASGCTRQTDRSQT